MSESEDILAQANTPLFIKDEKSRSLEVLRLTGSKLSRFLLMAGAVAGGNGIWLSGTLARAAVRSIDQKPVFPATTIDQAHGLWDQVDDVAAAAVIAHWQSMDGEEGLEAAKN